MRTSNTPLPGPRYWVLIAVASVFGANLGDFASHDLHLGHWHGLLPMAVVLGAILWGEQRTRIRTEAFYWLAIVTVRTAATNLADLTTHDLKTPYGWAVAGLTVALAVWVLVAGLRERTRWGLPQTGLAYWIGMLLAGTLGTAIGDGVADEVGLGVLMGSVALGLITAVLFALRQRASLALVVGYWVAVVAIRAVGTTLGDLSAHTMGLEASTLVSGVILAAGVMLWKQTAPSEVTLGAR